MYANDNARTGGHRLDPLLAPSSIAFVGASQRPNSVGNDMVRVVATEEFSGRIYPINPKYDAIEGLTCYPNLADLPETVDHVVLGVANQRLETALIEAIEHGAKAATIFASCLLENDVTPNLRERLAAIAREASIVICGGNGMGFCNPEIGLQVAAFPAPRLKPGGITWIGQSGSVYGALAFNDERLKFNLCVSSGAELVTTCADYLDWALSRASTRVIGMFLESVRDPAGFEVALASAADRKIPVVILKAGRTPASAAMARTHTGAIAGTDAAYRALFDRYGVMRVATLDEMAAALMLFSNPRRAAAGGVASIHDSGGECELLIDLAADIDLPIARINETTKQNLRENLESGLDAVNPLDAWGTGHNAIEIFENCFSALLEDPDTGVGLIVSDMRDIHYHHKNLSQVARAVAAKTEKPVVFVNNYSLLNHKGLSLELTQAGVPVLDGMPQALIAIKHLFAYRDFLATPRVPAPCTPTNTVSNKWIVRLRDSQRIDDTEAFALLADYGIPVTPLQVVATEEGAIRAADVIGYPVVLKIAETGMDHKSDSGGVKLNLADAAAVSAAYHELAQRIGSRVSVAKMLPAGVELGLGMVNDLQFGPYVMVSAGGVLIELLRDNAVTMAPVDKAKALELVARLQVSRLLDGFRGRPPVDRGALADVIVLFSQLAYDLKEMIDEIDINPVIVTSEGCHVVDVLLVTRPSDSRADQASAR